MHDNSNGSVSRISIRLLKQQPDGRERGLVDETCLCGVIIGEEDYELDFYIHTSSSYIDRHLFNRLSYPSWSLSMLIFAGSQVATRSGIRNLYHNYCQSQIQYPMLFSPMNVLSHKYIVHCDDPQDRVVIVPILR